MALRDENYLFTRRVADRGSDKIEFDSQDRMIQETDPKNVIWDEIVGKEEHPEEGDGYKFQETDSKAFIRDENYGKEEYPGNCSTLYSSRPCFDSYGDEEVSNEDYLWVTRALNVVFVQEGGPVVQEEISGDVTRSIESQKLGVYRRDFVRSGFNQPIKKANVEHPRDRESVRCGMQGLFQLAYGGLKEKQVMILVNLIQNIPYDPGGCGSDPCSQACGKLEDEFFSKKGRMMRMMSLSQDGMKIFFIFIFSIKISYQLVFECYLVSSLKNRLLVSFG